MTNKLPSSNKNKWALLRRWLPVVLLCFMDRWDGGDLDYIRARACRCSGQR